MDPLRLFLLDQGFPVEYKLDEFNTPHTGTTLRHFQTLLCWLRCRIPLRHLATSPLGNIFWRHARFFTNNQNHKITVTSTSISSNSKHDFATYGEHNPSHVQRHALLSLLSHNSISSLYFFPFPRGLQHKRKLFIPCCHKNLHVKANGIFVFLLLHPPLLTTTISEGITHTRKNTFLRPKVITNIPLAKYIYIYIYIY